MKDIMNLKGWVVVAPNRLHEFEGFAEAFTWQIENVGHLMTKSFYQTTWLPERVLSNLDTND